MTTTNEDTTNQAADETLVIEAGAEHPIIGLVTWEPIQIPGCSPPLSLQIRNYSAL